MTVSLPSDMGGTVMKFRSSVGPGCYGNAYPLYTCRPFGRLTLQPAASETPNSNQPEVSQHRLSSDMFSDLLLPACILPVILVSIPSVNFFLKKKVECHCGGKKKKKKQH